MKQGKTLEQLGTELQRQQNSRADFIADTRQLNFSTENNKSRITFESGNKTMDFGINPLAHQQIASRLGIPLKYYQRMYPKGTRDSIAICKNKNINYLHIISIMK